MVCLRERGRNMTEKRGKRTVVYCCHVPGTGHTIDRNRLSRIQINMVSKLLSLTYSGLDVHPVEVEVDSQRGLPAVSLVGMLDTSAKESRDRVRSGVKNSGYLFPAQRITVNVAPANVKKEGSHFDLAIALGLLQASGQISVDFSDYVILGELSLEGKIRRVNGVFPVALKARELKKKLIVPCDNACEAALVEGIEVYPVATLNDAVGFLSGTIAKDPVRPVNDNTGEASRRYAVDFDEVKGQMFAKRAMEIAVSGMHNMILIGPPGVGKTMLARRVPTILPDMSYEESLEVTKIYSIAGLLDSRSPLLKCRPFRNPHHTASGVALVGGRAQVQPGEITLAHYGVLFLDELPEFPRNSLEALRQPIEEGVIHIARASRRVRLPARFLLIAAMNPCPCGYFNSHHKACHCSSSQIQRYRNKVSGPLLDRIDIHIELQNVRMSSIMADDITGENSYEIKKRVEEARKIQRQRFSSHRDNTFFNARMNHKQIRKYCTLNHQAKTLVEAAAREFAFSARAYDKILKISRTIADLAHREHILPAHVAEAVQYRSLDRNLWM